MKKSIKLIIFTLLLALTLIPISVSAEEYQAPVGIEAKSDAVDDIGEELQNQDTSQDSEPNSDQTDENTPQTDEDAGLSGDIDEDTVLESNNGPFAVIYSFALEHIGEIFSILSFLGAAVIAFLYKKGLLPALQSSLESMAKMLTGIRETAEKSECVSAEIKQEIATRLSEAEGGIGTIRVSLDNLSSRLDGLSLTSDEHNRMREIMKAQIDMLYEIFLSSSLPEYQKEAIREKMGAMKEVLACEPKTNSN